MKKLLLLSAVALIAFSGQSNKASTTVGSDTTAAHQLVNNNYTWYLDSDMEDPTGTTSAIITELTRLRNLHPGYVFSSSFSIGLHEYEYGDSPYYFTAIIFSNR